jgi:hypothetical protein
MRTPQRRRMSPTTDDNTAAAAYPNVNAPSITPVTNDCFRRKGPGRQCLARHGVRRTPQTRTLTRVRPNVAQNAGGPCQRLRDTPMTAGCGAASSGAAWTQTPDAPSLWWTSRTRFIPGSRLQQRGHHTHAACPQSIGLPRNTPRSITGFSLEAGHRVEALAGQRRRPMIKIACLLAEAPVCFDRSHLATASVFNPTAPSFTLLGCERSHVLRSHRAKRFRKRPTLLLGGSPASRLPHRDTAIGLCRITASRAFMRRAIASAPTVVSMRLKWAAQSRMPPAGQRP